MKLKILTIIALCFVFFQVSKAQNLVLTPNLGHTAEIADITYSPDGKYFISGSFNGIIKLWDANSDKEIRTFYGHTKPIQSLSFSLDGKHIISGSKDKTIKLWDIKSGKVIKSFNPHYSYLKN